MRGPLVVALLALAAAAPAQAKEIRSAKACGASGCATASGKAFPGPHDGSSPFESQMSADWPAAPAPYYRVRILWGAAGDLVFGKSELYYVPGQAKLTMPREAADRPLFWVRVRGAWKAALDRLVRRVDAYPTPRVTRVTIDGRAVDDPQSYLELWTLREKPTGYATSLGRPIVFTSAARSPWTDGPDLFVWPRKRLLQRGYQLVSVPAEVAARIEARESLDSGGRSFPWLPLAVGLGVAGVVVTSMLAAWRLPPRRARARTA